MSYAIVAFIFLIFFTVFGVQSYKHSSIQSGFRKIEPVSIMPSRKNGENPATTEREKVEIPDFHGINATGSTASTVGVVIPSYISEIKDVALNVSPAEKVFGDQIEMSDKKGPNSSF